MSAPGRLAMVRRVAINAYTLLSFTVRFGVYDLLAVLSGESRHAVATSDVTDGETITPPGGER